MKTEFYLEYQMLAMTLRYHKYLYYKLARPTITDYEYDQLEKRFDALATQYGLPKSWVGSFDKEEG